MSRTVEEITRDEFLAEAESLAQITAHPAWKRFEELLVQMRLGAMEHMAQAPMDQIPYWQGVVATLREIRERPGQIVAAGRVIADEEAAQRESERQALDYVRAEVEGDDL